MLGVMAIVRMSGYKLRHKSFACTSPASAGRCQVAACLHTATDACSLHWPALFAIPMYQQGGFAPPPGGYGPPGGFGGAPGAPSFGGHAPAPYHAAPQQLGRQQDDRYAGKAAKDPVLAVSRCGSSRWRPSAFAGLRVLRSSIIFPIAPRRWLKARSQKEKLILGVVAGIAVRSGSQRVFPLSHMSIRQRVLGAQDARGSLSTCAPPFPACCQALLLLWFVVEDHDTLFILSESVHFLGIGLLAYKLIKKRAAGGGSGGSGDVRLLCAESQCCMLQGTGPRVPQGSIAGSTTCSRMRMRHGPPRVHRRAEHAAHASSMLGPLPRPAGLSLRTQELTAAFLAVRLFCSFMMEYDIHTLLDLLTLLATGWVIFSLRGPLKESYQVRPGRGRCLPCIQNAWRPQLATCSTECLGRRRCLEGTLRAL